VAVQERLQAVLDYACGPDGADCKGIQPDATCFKPNTMVFEKRLGKASFPRFKIFFFPHCNSSFLDPAAHALKTKLPAH
jgi:hypothetical protein